MEVKYDAMGNLTCVLDMDGYEYALTVRSHAIRRVVERWAYKNLMTSAETGKLFADMMLCKSMADWMEKAIASACGTNSRTSPIQ